MDTVEDWNDIIDNLRQFKYIAKQDNTHTLNRFASFFHWYYFPKEDAFAPSKFIGYKGTTISSYSGKGNGGVTENALRKYFDVVLKDSKLFNELYEKLEHFAKSVGKSINSRVLSNNGEIHIPKRMYEERESQYSQELFEISINDIESLLAENDASGLEGTKYQKLINFYERNPSLRAKAIQIHGTTCKVCDFNFMKSYGSHGEDYIEVHHLKALHSMLEASMVNPKIDMTVLCANCHRMIHRKKNNALTIEALKKIWQENNSN